ncbi:hypothetical protein [Melaminivora suipulveris]|uniref:hypothetical protein n=1 Tax=Melaminivora suipulveris TaxID=2109913 RepID=UPI00131A57CA|nr:hypothetical protein [Melaminivora suipulveris]
MNAFQWIAASALLAGAGASFAHGATGHHGAGTPALQQPWGIAGHYQAGIRGTVTVNP